MEEKNKNMWMIAGVVLIVIAVIVFFATQKNDADDILEDQNTIAEEQVVVEDENVPGEIDTEGQPDVASSPAASLSYAQALVDYKGARLQLDKVCQASPNNMTFKNGASMMLDNRSAVSRTVKVGSTYTIKPWGFRIIKLSSSTVPVTYLVDCDQSQNVATILLQG